MVERGGIQHDPDRHVAVPFPVGASTWSRSQSAASTSVTLERPCSWSRLSSQRSSAARRDSAATACPVLGRALPDTRRYDRPCKVRARGLSQFAVLVLVLAAGCTGTGDQAERGSPDPSRTPATTTPERYEVPAAIDAAYVNRVLAALDAVDGEVFRLYLRDRAISPGISARIKALYGTGEKYDRTVRELEDERDNRPAREPGNRITTVTRLITTTPTCIYAQVTRDFRPVMGTVSGLVAWVGLRPISALAEQGQYNPTPWGYVVDGFMPDRSEPPNPCAAS